MKNKIKTHSGAKKRFRFTANGKVKYQTTNRRHRLAQKATNRKRNNRSNSYANDADMKEIKALMPYAK
ncbi:MAG: 50S ribosomal protein L35 [Ruminococcaceae bacterium]|nr:50S ribosomal protein L35 [Oscillospiraceae bacterium]MBD5114986.1 50S ribosomal protein L35 [Oscillospiraceae bacterium]MCM1055042.1 50S ribosomal protein L35 [Bacteroides sp.]